MEKQRHPYVGDHNRIQALRNPLCQYKNISAFVQESAENPSLPQTRIPTFENLTEVENYVVRVTRAMKPACQDESEGMVYPLLHHRSDSRSH